MQFTSTEACRGTTRARETRLAAKRESEKRRRAEESQEQQENRLAADRKSKKRKRAEESQEQPENYRLVFRYNLDHRQILINYPSTCPESYNFIPQNSGESPQTTCFENL